MANSILTLRVLSNGLLQLLGTHLQSMGRAVYAESFPTGQRLGDTVVIQEPLRFEPWGKDPPDFKDIFSRSVTASQVVLQHQIKAEFAFDSGDLTLNLDTFFAKHLENAAYILACQVYDLWPAGADLVAADLALPVGVREAALSSDPNRGLSIRCLTDYDPLADVYRFRADMLFGFTPTAELLYVPSPVEQEMITLLLEAKQQLTQQLQAYKLAA